MKLAPGGATREHRVGVVLEIRVDLRLLDLRADFLWRVRSQAERLQPSVDLPGNAARSSAAARR